MALHELYPGRGRTARPTGRVALALAGLLLVAGSLALVGARAGVSDVEGRVRPVLAGPAHAAPSTPSATSQMPPGLAPVAAAVMAPPDYYLTPHAGVYGAANKAQGLAASFSAAGVQLQPTGSDAAVSLSLTGVGRAGALAAPQPAAVVADGARAEYRRGPLTEWYVNDPKGVEQGFTLDSAPPGDPSRPVVVEVASAGGLAPILDPATSSVRFEADGTSVGYSGLHAYDATGRFLPSHLGLDGTTVTLSVDDAGAVYPLTIDPLIATEQAHLFRADSGGANSELGVSVAVDGNTAVVGAFVDTGIAANTGVAYVFVRSGSTWTVQARLFASDGADHDLFGASVAISGDTVVVGAYFDDSPAADAGSAYVFVRSGTTWSQQAKLVAPDASALDFFGFSVAVSGDTAVVGASGDDTNAGANAGSAYVFVRSGSAWTYEAQLFGSQAAADDGFGVSVALVGDTAVVGAPGNAVGAANTVGSAYVFTRSGTTWTGQARLTASDGALGDEFGFSVALSGDTAVVGARNDDDGAASAGSAYVFLRTGTTWAQQAKLVADDPGLADQFGTTVAISGDTVVVGSPGDDTVAGGTNAGSAYVFVRTGTAWAQQAHLFASDGAASDFYGLTVAISADTTLVGAPVDDNLAGTNAGSAYVYVRSGTAWPEQAHLFLTGPGANAFFGTSVAVDGNTAVVGAFGDTGIAANTGAVYVFVRSGSTWTVQARLFASDGADADLFGASVAISGDTVVVGAYFDDSPANNAGSAYVFVRSGTTWSQQAQLVAPDASALDFFGFSVAVSGDTALIGAQGDDTVAGANAGSAYVFVRTGTSWTFQAQLFAADAGADAGFGVSVALVGDTAVVGAPGNSTGAASTPGAAYVFTRSGTAWTQQAKLTASDGALGDEFGFSVALSGESAVIGARNDDDGAISAGSAYVFVRTGTTWAQQAKLVADDPGAGDQFGTTVAISGDTAVVGSPGDDTGAGTNAGSAYVYARSGTTWTQQAHLFASDGAASDFYGISVAVSGTTVVVGAEVDDTVAGTNAGSAYVYTLQAATATLTTQASATGAVGQAISDTATVTGTGTPTGTVTFTSYAPGDTMCAARPVFTSAPQLLVGGTASSGPFTPTAPGTYRWRAVYSGDINNDPANGACNDPNEASTVSQATPTIATSATTPVVVGGPVSDTATVTGAASPAPAPTGTVTFTLFGPANPTCAGNPIFTSSPAVLAGGPPPTASSGNFTPAGVGTYNWVAVYSGDANYVSVTSPCGAPNEASTVGSASPTISTHASAGGVVGTSVTDTASVAGGVSPTGTVTFRLFTDSSCGTQVFTSTNALSGGSATSTSFTPGAAGTYYWTAVYSGDANNNTAVSGCNAANESVTITAFQAPPYTRTITGDLAGPVTVNNGESVLITAARVLGPVTVNTGGALTVVNSQITKGITATAPSFFSLCGTKVSGPTPAPTTALTVTNAPVAIRVGDPAVGCAGNQFAGQVVLTGNAGVTFGGNGGSQGATVDNNGPTAVVVKANTLLGTLACSGNNPAPTNAGQVNTAPSKTGQCATL